MDKVFNGLLAGVPAILDSFFTSTTSTLVWGWRVGGGGWVNAFKILTVMLVGPNEALLCYKSHKKLPNQ